MSNPFIMFGFNAGFQILLASPSISFSDGRREAQLVWDACLHAPCSTRSCSACRQQLSPRQSTFTLSASYFHFTCPCYLSLHLVVTSPIASTSTDLGINLHETNTKRWSAIAPWLTVYCLFNRRRGAKYAAGSACIGGGQGIAILLESVNWRDWDYIKCTNKAMQLRTRDVTIMSSNIIPVSTQLLTKMSLSILKLILRCTVYHMYHLVCLH